MWHDSSNTTYNLTLLQHQKQNRHDSTSMQTKSPVGLSSVQTKKCSWRLDLPLLQLHMFLKLNSSMQQAKCPWQWLTASLLRQMIQKATECPTDEAGGGIHQLPQFPRELLLCEVQAGSHNGRLQCFWVYITFTCVSCSLALHWWFACS